MLAEPRTILELSRALRTRERTAEQITGACLAQIAARDRTLNAFITVLADEALDQARAADREIASGSHRGPLHGVPISLKDLFDLQGTPTTAASKVREGHRATGDAPSVARLREAGAVFIGKTNLHEFALGPTNEDSAFGPARHPLDDRRLSGGSSGGSAVSVATGMAYGSVGSDTGGSVRIPAAACGLVGLKPALGEIPTGGVVPLSTSLDCVGPLCQSVEDAALLYDVMRGVTPAPIEPRPLAGLRVGIPRGYFFAQLDPSVGSQFNRLCDRLSDAGVRLDDVTIPHAEEIVAVYTHIVLAEAAALHARTLETRASDYTPNVRVRLEMGRYILAEDYVRALRGREALTHDVERTLAGRDALLLPTIPIPAPLLGVATVPIGSSEEPVRNLLLRLTQLFNLTGHPALTLPCGLTPEGLPVGAQLVAPHTRSLLQIAAAAEGVAHG